MPFDRYGRSLITRKEDTMTREELLKELKSIDLHAMPTVVTMDMGLQYDYATSEGAGTGFGGMGDWPAYMFESIEKEKWIRIRARIKDNTLMAEDLKGTGLDVLLDKVHSINYEIVPSEVLKGLLDLPEELTGSYFCFFDAGQWFDQYAEKPMFFTSDKELKEEFISRFVDDLTKWEEMDDDELKNWYERLQDEMSDFAIYTCDPE